MRTGTRSFSCPKCQHRGTAVKDSRPVKDGTEIRRRRFCIACGHRFTTLEQLYENARPLRSGRLKETLSRLSRALDNAREDIAEVADAIKADEDSEPREAIER